MENEQHLENEKEDLPTLLTHGVVTGPKELGPTAKYVLVPKGWRRQNDTYLSEIFSALGLSLPPLVFICGKSTNIFPGTIGMDRTFGDNGINYTLVYENATEEQKRFLQVVMKAKLESVMQALSGAMVQCKALYLMMEPFAENESDTMICDTLSSSSVAIGAVSQKFIQHFIRRNAAHPQELMSKNFSKHAYQLQESIRSTAKWPPLREWTEDGSSQQAEEDKPPVAYLVNGLTHLLIFDNDDDKQYFVNIAKQTLPLGILCMGGTNPLLISSLHALCNRIPLFVFKHTVRSGHCLSALIEFHRDLLNNEGNVQSIEDRLMFDANNPYELFADELNGLRMVERVQKVAYNWPKNFSEESVLLIDLLTDEADDLVMRFIEVMSVIESAPSLEPGGEQSERVALQQAQLMIRHLEHLLKQQRRITFVLYASIVVVTFGVTLVSCVSQYSKEEGNSLQPSDGNSSIFRAVNIALPIVLGMLLTIYATMQPGSKWATIEFAKARIEGEAYKYRCGVGAYRRNYCAYPSHSHPREAFMTQLREIWDSVESIELAYKVSEGEKKLQQWLSPPTPVPKSATLVPSNSRSAKNRMVHPLRAKEYRKDLASIGQDLEEQPFASKQAMVTSANRKTEPTSSGKGDEISQLNLTADEYLVQRVLEELKRLERENPWLLASLRFYQIGIIVISSAGTILAAYEQQLWIPLVLAMAHALELAMNFRSLPLRLQRANICYSRLQQVVLWWSGLSLFDQRLQQAKFKLVLNVENILLSTIEVITSAQLKREEQQEDDASKDSDLKRAVDEALS